MQLIAFAWRGLDSTSTEVAKVTMGLFFTLVLQGGDMMEYLDFY
jgi:hypothetical protein